MRVPAICFQFYLVTQHTLTHTRFFALFWYASTFLMKPNKDLNIIEWILSVGPFRLTHILYTYNTLNDAIWTRREKTRLRHYYSCIKFTYVCSRGRALHCIYVYLLLK